MSALSTADRGSVVVRQNTKEFKLLVQKDLFTKRVLDAQRKLLLLLERYVINSSVTILVILANIKVSEGQASNRTT